MLAAIDFDYSTEAKLKAMTPMQYEAVRTRMPQLKLPEAQEEVKSYYMPSGILVDDCDMIFLTTSEFKYTISRIKGVASADPRNPSYDLPQVINQISVANVGLLQVTAVMVEEDCCTDKLQDFLDDGWRLLAVCPPNDTRRPSYVLGHTDRSKRG